MVFSEFDEVTRNEALRAVTAASRDDNGRQVLDGTIGTIPTRWALPFAVATIRAGAGAGVARIFWDADTGGLALVDADDEVLFRFDTPDPFDLPAPGPPPDTGPARRPALPVVRPAS